MRNILLTGVGGQGTVLASKLIAQAALDAGCFVRSAETIGMAQRGGSVTSHVRIVTPDERATGETVFSPLIPRNEADLIIAFEPAEAVRALPYLRPGGTLITARSPIRPVTATLSGGAYDGNEQLKYLQSNEGSGGIGRLIVIDGEAICAQCGSSKVLNVSLLGAAAQSGTLGFTSDQIEIALETRVKERFIVMNKQALALGAWAADQ